MILANDDIRQIGVLFASGKGEGNREIDYVRMSKELNLHYGCLNYLSSKQSQLDHDFQDTPVKEAIAKTDFVWP